MSFATHPTDTDDTEPDDDASAEQRVRALERIERYIEFLYDRKITREFDRIIPVIGDEGMGKSTFMLQFTWLWQQNRGLDPTPDSVLDRIVWDDRNEFKTAMARSERRSTIMIQDAARVLHKRETWDQEQLGLEKDLLDSRMKEFVILLGYQDWDLIPTFLQERRAKNAFVIPNRGTVRGFARSGIDKRFEKGRWPDPHLSDRFPSLEGTSLWERFKESDLQHKNERIDPSDGSEEEDPLTPQEIAEEILEEGVENWVSIHGGNKTRYIDKELIRADYQLSHSDASTVKKLLDREVDVGRDK